jgi:hypothetical protein
MGTGDTPDDETEESGHQSLEYQTNWDRSDPDTISSTIVRAVATTKDVDPTGIVTPLNETLDADALVNVLASGAGNGNITITFDFADRQVTARDDGQITVRAAE